MFFICYRLTSGDLPNLVWQGVGFFFKGEDGVGTETAIQKKAHFRKKLKMLI